MSTTSQFKQFGPFFDAGQLVGSPRIWHYIAGTATLKNAWTDYTKLVTAAQPIVGDANGVASAFFDGLYKIQVRKSDDTTVLFTWDNVAFNLTDYTETTWIPSVGGTATYTEQYGFSARFGNLVYINARMGIDVIGTGSTGSISGLPALPNRDAALSVGKTTGLALSVVSLNPIAVGSLSRIDILGRTAAAAAASSAIAALGSGSTIEISGIYTTDD